MHVAIAVLTVLASFRYGKWKNWREFQASMFFITTGGLLYEYIVQDYSLWKFHPDFLYGHRMTVIVYTLLTMPVSILMFISHFPKRRAQRFFYILCWSVIYISVEWVLLVAHRISYDHGWNIFHSFLFDMVMFAVIALHQFHPFKAYLLSIIIILFMITVFKVPFTF